MYLCSMMPLCSNKNLKNFKIRLNFLETTQLICMYAAGRKVNKTKFSLLKTDQKHQRFLVICSVLNSHQINIITCDSQDPLASFSTIIHRITNLDTIVRIADRELPVVNTRGDVLFNSWNSIFNGQGGYFPQTPRIYSFSGKNVLTDISW